MKRTYASGRQKQKAAEEKKQKDADLIAKLPKLSNLFATKQSTAADVRENERDDISSVPQSTETEHVLSTDSAETGNEWRWCNFDV